MHKIFLQFIICSKAGKKEPSEELESAIDNMTKKTKDLRRQVCSVFQFGCFPNY